MAYRNRCSTSRASACRRSSDLGGGSRDEPAISSRLFQVTETTSSQLHLPLEFEKSGIARNNKPLRCGQERLVPRQGVLEVTLSLIDLNQLGGASEHGRGSRSIERLSELYGSAQMRNG